MSPLASSLLALAMLLAAADGHCTTKQFGQITQYPVEVLPSPMSGRVINIPDKCQGTYEPGFYRVGERITACNIDPDGMAPVINEANPPALSPVLVDCIFCPLGVTLAIVEYCSYGDN